MSKSARDLSGSVARQTLLHSIPLRPASRAHRLLRVVIVLAVGLVSLGASEFGSRNSNIAIPDNGDWVSSTISTNGAPSGATVTGIDVHFEIVHPYSGDLDVDLNAVTVSEALGIILLGNYDLWSREGGSADNPSRTVNGISAFNGLSVNRTWYLYARDYEALDSGYIDYWWIRVYYQAPANPTISSVSPNPVPGSNSSQTLIIYGSDFVSGVSVRLEDLTNGGVFNKPTSYVNSSQVTISANFTTAAATWTAQAINPDGGSSNVYSFSVEAPALPPSAPVLVSPGISGLPGPMLTTTTPVFQWQAVSGATGYGLYISRQFASGSYQLVFDSELHFGGPIPGTPLILPSGYLSAGNEYRWNMQAYNSAGWGQFSGRFYFTLGSRAPPPAPTLLAPGSSQAPGPKVGISTPSFQWQTSVGATNYRLYISRQLGNGSYQLIFDSQTEFGSISETWFSLPSGYLQSDREYRWRIRAANSVGWGADSISYYFSVRADDPPSTLEPVPQSPGAANSPGPELPAGALNLSWQPSGGEQFEVLLERFSDGDYNPVFHSDPLSATTAVILANSLIPGMQHRWSVRAFSSTLGCSAFSHSLYFRIESVCGDLGQWTSDFRLPIGTEGPDGGDLHRLDVQEISDPKHPDYSYPAIVFDEDGDGTDDWYVVTAHDQYLSWKSWPNDPHSPPTLKCYRDHLDLTWNCDAPGTCWDSQNAVRHPGEDWNRIDGERSTDAAYAIADGVVAFSGCTCNYGYTVIIAHRTRYGEIISSLYGHLESPLLKKCKTVYRGDRVGFIGTSKGINGECIPAAPDCSGYIAEHLHFELRGDRMIDPDITPACTANLWPETLRGYDCPWPNDYDPCDGGHDFIYENYLDPSAWFQDLFHDSFNLGDTSLWDGMIGGE